MVSAIIKKLDESTSDFDRSILAVYAQSDNEKEKPEHVGTAFLMRLVDREFFVTANHVIQSAHSMGAVFFANKQGRWFSLRYLQERSKRLFSCVNRDIFVLEVEGLDEGICSFGCSVFVADDIPDSCVSMGFPNSKNKRNVSPKEMVGKLVSLKLHLFNKNSNGEDVPQPSSSCFFNKWGEKTSMDKDRVVKNSIALRGMSGSPCFYVPISAEVIQEDRDVCSDVMIAGVLIEHKNSLIKFVRIREILSIVF